MRKYSTMLQSGSMSVISLMYTYPFLLHSLIYVTFASIVGFVVILSGLDSNPVKVVTVLLLILTFVYVSYRLYIDVQIAINDPDTSLGICANLFAGSLLLGFIALLFALITAPTNKSLAGLAIIILLASLGSLRWVVISARTLTQQKDYSMPIPIPNQPPPLPPPFPSSGISYEPRHSSLPLRPLFEDDPLYQMPEQSTLQRSRLFYLVKEREDACAISPRETRFVLSDGASASSLPRPWATLLGQHWIKKPFIRTDTIDLDNWLEEPRTAWEQWVKQTWYAAVNERNRLTGDYPVREEDVYQILDRGAFATLLGVSINYQSYQWQALAIGDTCLFLVRPSSPEQIITSLPMTRSTDFTNRPPLLSTQRDMDVASLHPYMKYHSGTYQKGDILFMATDALAQWLLLQHEQEKPVWQYIMSIPDNDSFARFVHAQRQDGAMEEDDTTLIIIQL